MAPVQHLDGLEAGNARKGHVVQPELGGALADDAEVVAPAAGGKAHVDVVVGMNDGGDEKVVAKHELLEAFVEALVGEDVLHGADDRLARFGGVAGEGTTGETI